MPPERIKCNIIFGYETCGPLISTDISNYNNKINDNTYKDRCNIIVKYDSLIPAPPKFSQLNYMDLKKNMKDYGNQNIFTDIVPTDQVDIYDQYMDSEFQKKLDTIPDVFQKANLTFSQFLIQPTCNKINIKYVNMGSPLMTGEKLITMVNKNKTDLVLELKLGNGGKSSRVLAETEFVGIPTEESCFYYTPAPEETTIAYSLDGAVTWTSVNLFLTGKYTKDKLLERMNFILGKIIQDYTIIFSAVNVEGCVPHKQFSIMMTIKYNNPVFKSNYKTDVISKFRIKSFFPLLCFSTITEYKIFEKNITKGVIKGVIQGVIQDVEIETGGFRLFDINVYMTANNKITIHTFFYSSLMHQFMHVLGFKHTHQLDNPNNPCNIDADWEGNIQNESANYFLMSRQKYGVIAIQDFDQSSIMTYKIGSIENKKLEKRAGMFFWRNYKISDIDKRNLAQFYQDLPPPPGGNLRKSSEQNKFIKFLFGNPFIIILLGSLVLIIIILLRT